VPDQTALSEDQTRAAFAALRAEALPEVRGPGVDVVRHTVRRRRKTAAVTSAFVVAGLVAGGFAVASHVAGGSDPVPLLAAPADEQPDALARARQADEALTQGDSFAGGSGPAVARLDLSQVAVQPSTYTVEVACIGSGSATFTLSVGEASVHEPVTCAATPHKTTLRLTAPDGGPSMSV
jgi:hypothetical protein